MTSILSSEFNVIFIRSYLIFPGVILNLFQDLFNSRVDAEINSAWRHWLTIFEIATRNLWENNLSTNNPLYVETNLSIYNHPEKQGVSS